MTFTNGYSYMLNYANNAVAFLVDSNEDIVCGVTDMVITDTRSNCII